MRKGKYNKIYHKKIFKKHVYCFYPFSLKTLTIIIFSSLGIDIGLVYTIYEQYNYILELQKELRDLCQERKILDLVRSAFEEVNTLEGNKKPIVGKYSLLFVCVCCSLTIVYKLFS